MQLSKNVLFIVLMAMLTTSSCLLVPDVDQTAVVKKDLQKKEWTLTRFIINGQEQPFTPQVFNFISDTEFEFSFEENGSMRTETYEYNIDFATDYNVKFNIDVPSAFLIFPVVSVTNNSLTISSNNGALLLFE